MLLGKDAIADNLTEDAAPILLEEDCNCSSQRLVLNGIYLGNVPKSHRAIRTRNRNNHKQHADGLSHPDAESGTTLCSLHVLGRRFFENDTKMLQVFITY